jgi:hypothetical protein
MQFCNVREYLLEQGMGADEISVLNTGRKKRKAKQAKE